METDKDIFIHQNTSELAWTISIHVKTETRSYPFVSPESTSIPEDLGRGVVIAVPIIAVLILAPLLLSYSRRRLAMKWCPMNNPSSIGRDPELGYFEDSVAHTVTANQPVNLLTTPKNLEKIDHIEPSLKRGKMFIESELSAEPVYENARFNPRSDCLPPNLSITKTKNRTEVNRTKTKAQSRDRIHSTPCILDTSPRIAPPITRPVSVDLGDDFGAEMKEIICYENIQTAPRIIPGSRLTIYENAAYEDTIPSSVGSQLNVASAKATAEGSEKDNLKEEEIYHEIQTPFQRRMPHIPHQLTIVKVEIHNPSHSVNGSSHAFSPDCIYEPAEDLPNLSTVASSCPKFITQKRFKKELTPPDVETTLEQNRTNFAKQTKKGCLPTCSMSHEVAVKKERIYENQVTDVSIEKTDCSFGITSPAFSSDKSQSTISHTRDRSTPSNNLQRSLPHQPLGGTAGVDVKIAKTRKRKRKVKKSRRERNELRRKWQQRLLVPTPEVKIGTGDSYSFRSNETASGYIGNRRFSIDKFDQNSSLRRQEAITRQQRASENTLLREIWKHLTVLVEESVANHDISTSGDNNTKTNTYSSTKTVVPRDFF